MKKKTIRSKMWAWAAIAALFCCIATQARSTDATLNDAASVRRLLQGITTGRLANDGRTGTAAISEPALNAYIAERLAREKVPAVRRLTVRLLDLDHIGGRVDFDAGQLKLDTLLGADLTFDFKGILQNRGRAARLHLIALTLNGYPVKPQVLDFVLGRLAVSDRSEPERIGSWHPLPRGIQHIGVSDGNLIVSY